MPELDGQEEFEADAWLLEELVVEYGPDEGSHAGGVTGDDGGFIDTVHEDEDPAVVEEFEGVDESLGQAVAAVIGVLGAVDGEGLSSEGLSGEVGG